MSPMSQPVGHGVRNLDLPERSPLVDRVAAVASLLAVTDVLELPTSCVPVEALRSRGWFVDADASWLRVSLRPVPPLVVLTELEAPEPMHRILARLTELEPGEVMLALLPHRPAPLLPHLDARGAQYDVALRPDGDALLWLTPGT